MFFIVIHEYTQKRFFSRVLFANTIARKISRVFNFAKLTKIREIRENLYPRKFLPLRYTVPTCQISMINLYGKMAI